jgi:hypothetical protein
MRGRRGRVLVLVLVAVAIIAGTAALTAWVISLDEDDEPVAATTTPPARQPTLSATARQLARRATAIGHVVYWAGPVAGRRYELTTTEDGRAYVRYLPRSVRAGDPRPRFITIGTYLLEDAFAITRATSRRADARRVRAPAGAIAFYTTARPQSVYLANEGSDLQIEVFHPVPRQARRLVETGKVRPVG